MKSISLKILKNLESSNKKIIGNKINKNWNWYTSENLINRFYECKGLLKHNNFKKNDRLIYKGKNSFDFIAWNLAVNSEGGIWVPVYHNQNKDYLNYIVEDCSPKMLISDDKTKYNNVNCLDSNEKISIYDNYEIFLKNDISTLIYTSGTTGNPKGVMLNDENILSNINGIKNIFSDFEGKEITSLNILPWAHIYSITTELYYNLLQGNKMALSSGPDNFVKEIYEIKPNVLYLVPKVLNLIKSKLCKLDYPIIRHSIPLILNKLFGNNFITIFCGGAKLDEDTFLFFKKYGIKICIGYGCSETSPMVSLNHLSYPRNEMSVGKLLDDVIVEIVGEEVYVSGPNVMQGYWNDKEETEKVLKDINGKTFYKTGDSGKLINNFLFLEGRISENYKLSNGKFVNVDNVESKIRKYLNGNFIIYGENKEYNILITDVGGDKSKIINICNQELEQYLKIKDILFIDSNEFQLYLTPKMSIKRKKIILDNLEKINNIYN